jgi:hypothetical protein
MDDYYVFVFALVWLALCAAVGSAADNKGRSSVGYFLLSFLVSPLLAIIILGISGDTEDKRRQKLREEHEMFNPAPAPISIEPNTNSPEIGTIEKLEVLEKLGNLLEKGVLTKEEFAAEKKAIMLRSTHSASNIEATSNVEDQKEAEIKKAMLDLITTVNSMITETKDFTYTGFNDELLSALKIGISDKKSGVIFLSEYEKQYSLDVIAQLKGLATSSRTITHYVQPFIDMGVVENEFPHNRIL